MMLLLACTVLVKIIFYRPGTKYRLDDKSVHASIFPCEITSWHDVPARIDATSRTNVVSVCCGRPKNSTGPISNSFRGLLPVKQHLAMKQRPVQQYRVSVKKSENKQNKQYDPT